LSDTKEPPKNRHEQGSALEGKSAGSILHLETKTLAAPELRKKKGVLNGQIESNLQPASVEKSGTKTRPEKRNGKHPSSKSESPPPNHKAKRF